MPNGVAARARAGGELVRRAAQDPVLGATAALFTMVAGWFLLAPASPAARILVYWGVQLGLDLLMVLGCRRVTSATGVDALVARFWRWLARAGLLFAAGDGLQTWTACSHPGTARLTPEPGPAGLVAAGVLTMVVVMLTHPSQAPGAARTRLWLDAATVMAGAASLIWYFGAATGGLGSSLVSIVALVSVFGLVKLALAARPPFTRAATLTGVSGVALFGLADVLIGPVTSAGHPGAALALHLVPSSVIAITPRVQELQVRADPAALNRPRRPYSLLPYLAVAVTQVLLVRVALLSGWSVTAWGVAGGAVVVTSLVVARQLGALRENAALLSRLDAGLLTLTRQEQRFRSLVQHATDVTLIVAADGRVSYASPALASLVGILPEDAEGRPVLRLLHPGSHAEARRICSDLAARGPASGPHQLRARHSDGSVRRFEVTVTDLLSDPSVLGTVCNARDVTESIELHTRLQHQASHDALTQLCNRSAFDEALARARMTPAAVAVLLIDLDGFKPVNDTYGHHVGDALLVQAAERIRSVVRPVDTVARLGGDEFAVLLHDAGEQQAVAVAQRITSALRTPIPADGHQVSVTASVGVAVGLAAQAEELVRQADAAMYVVKRRGRDGYHCAAGVG